MKILRLLTALGVIVSINACQTDALEGLNANNSNFRVTSGAAAPLTANDFNRLSPENQYAVASKLLGTLYKGEPMHEFFDLKKGVQKLRPMHADFLNETVAQLNIRLDSRDSYAQLIEEKYAFNATRKPMAEPLAAMYELPVSRDQFEIWMAYTLANTILFSPAEEIDSASHIDVQKVHAGLARAMARDDNIRQIILTHMKSEANWRRFRSPEDNTREMIEIYLGLFDRDEDVPKASKACKNWYLTDDTEDYQLVVDLLDENTEPQLVLDNKWVTTCDEFYAAIAQHPLVIPRITTVLVDHFFPTSTSEKRATIVQSIVSSQPTHFKHIFIAMLFSKAYLLENERPKRFEEAFFGTGGRIYWHANRDFFNNITNLSTSTDFPTLAKMNQPAMTLKLGRWKDQPLDSLSFAVFHKGMREQLLLPRVSDKLNTGQRGWAPELLENALFLTGDDFINYLFLSVANRRASDEELKALNDFISDKQYDSNEIRKTQIVFDYLSRLPETYFLNKIEDASL
ncbi:MAG: hypothetical protein OEZ43_04145 [Gammaproteobacteria bacterium]|nr:hypothetical protein [Gammaproteobacteria bacterium]